VFAFNDANSLSGYHCMRFHLASKGLKGFFRSAVQTGGHRQSLEALLDGRADVAAVDESVLGKLRRDRTWRRRLSELTHLDDVKALGPFPGQPFVAHQSVGSKATSELQRAIVSAPPSVLAPLGWQRMVPVASADYECIRRKLKECASIDSLLCPAGQISSLVAEEEWASLEDSKRRRKRISPGPNSQNSRQPENGENNQKRARC